MSLRAAIFAGLAILGIALLGVWQFAPSVFAEARGLMDRGPDRTFASLPDAALRLSHC